MNVITNGRTTGWSLAALPTPVLQYSLTGQLVPIITGDRDRSAMLLDELDDQLADLDAALADQAAALGLLAEADRLVSMARARCRAIHAAIAVECAGHDAPGGAR